MTPRLWGCSYDLLAEVPFLWPLPEEEDQDGAGCCCWVALLLYLRLLVPHQTWYPLFQPSVLSSGYLVVVSIFPVLLKLLPTTEHHQINA